MLRKPKERPEQRRINRLPLHCITSNTKHHQQDKRQEHDYPEAHPVLIDRVHAFDFHKFSREVSGH